MQILYVDDNEIELDVFRVHFEKQGHTVSTYSTSMDIPGVLSVLKFDVIVLDMYMPDKDGIELLQHIKERYTTPVIIYSGNNDMFQVAKLMKADVCILKHPDMEDITLAVNHFNKYHHNDK